MRSQRDRHARDPVVLARRKHRARSRPDEGSRSETTKETGTEEAVHREAPDSAGRL